MAYQGVLAYFYDQIHPGHAVELDVCRYNQVVADVIWRGPQRMEEYHGQCRQYPPPGLIATPKDNTPERGACYDCRVLPVQETYTVHYTACKKPWECQLPYPRIPRNPAHAYRLRELTNVTTCGLLFREYFNYRQQVEEWLANKQSQSKTRQQAEPQQPRRIYNGTFHPEYFLGYCKGNGAYDAMEILPETWDMKELYGF